MPKDASSFTRSIAIDGPAAVGKSSVGRLLAERLSWLFVDTGSMYRAVTWLVLERGLNLEKESEIVRLAEGCRIEMKPGASPKESARVLVNGTDVTDSIKTVEVERAVSIVARMGGVRKALVRKQQEMAAGGKVIMAGRDIGTVVMSNARLKFFLTASPEVRAERRFKEMAHVGSLSYKETLEDLIRRDKLDSERSISPLKPAEDAIIIDTNSIKLEQVVDILFQHCKISGVEGSE